MDKHDMINEMNTLKQENSALRDRLSQYRDMVAELETKKCFTRGTFEELYRLRADVARYREAVEELERAYMMTGRVTTAPDPVMAEIWAAWGKIRELKRGAGEG